MTKEKLNRIRKKLTVGGFTDVDDLNEICDLAAATITRRQIDAERQRRHRKIKASKQHDDYLG